MAIAWMAFWEHGFSAMFVNVHTILMRIANTKFHIPLDTLHVFLHETKERYTVDAFLANLGTSNDCL